jgi:hypothetical protein
VVRLAPRVPGEIVDPRRLSDVVARPLNFTVRCRGGQRGRTDCPCRKTWFGVDAHWFQDRTAAWPRLLVVIKMITNTRYLSATPLRLVACVALLLACGCECPFGVQGTLRGANAEALSPPLIEVIGDAVKPFGFTSTKLRNQDLYAYEFGGGLLFGPPRIEITIDPKSLTMNLVDFGRHESKFNAGVLNAIQQHVTSAYGTSMDLRYQTRQEHYSCIFGP